jgi:hypothetical protein
MAKDIQATGIDVAFVVNATPRRLTLDSAVTLRAAVRDPSVSSARRREDQP